MSRVISYCLGLVAAFAVVGPLASAAPLQQREALIVGDSVSKLTIPYMLGSLASVRLEIWQEVNSNSARGVELLEDRYAPTQSVIVFDTGTLDPAERPAMLKRSLRKVAAKVGDRCLVVPTIERYRSGAENIAKNRAIFAFAASRPGTQVPEWAAIADMRPKLWLQPHDFHPNHEAATYRARLVTRAVRACFAYRSGDAADTEPTADATHISPVDRVSRRLASLAS
jgi:hypothetical protein